MSNERARGARACMQTHTALAGVQNDPVDCLVQVARIVQFVRRYSDKLLSHLPGNALNFARVLQLRADEVGKQRLNSGPE